MTQSMMQMVQRRLAASKGEWLRIAKGSGVDYAIVWRLANNKTKNARFNTIQKLADYFAKR